MKFVILVLLGISAVFAKDGECPSKSDIFKPPRHLRPMFCRVDDDCPEDLKCCSCHKGEVFFCVPPAGTEAKDMDDKDMGEWDRLKEEYKEAFEDDDDCDEWEHDDDKDDHDDKDDSDEREKRDEKEEKEEYYKKEAHMEKRRRCHEMHRHKRMLHVILFSSLGLVVLVAVVVTVTCCVRRRRQRMSGLQQKKTYIQTNIASAPNMTLTKADLKASLGVDFSNPMYQTLKPEETVNPQ